MCTCSRCRKVEKIPTHQFVKVDLNVQYLCADCWKGFRSWFFASERIRRVENQDLSPPAEAGGGLAWIDEREPPSSSHAA